MFFFTQLKKYFPRNNQGLFLCLFLLRPRFYSFSLTVYLKLTSSPLVYQAAVLLEQERQQEMAKMGGPRAMAPVSAVRGMMLL